MALHKEVLKIIHMYIAKKCSTVHIKKTLTEQRLHVLLPCKLKEDYKFFKEKVLGMALQN